MKKAISVLLMILSISIQASNENSKNKIRGLERNLTDLYQIDNSVALKYYSGCSNSDIDKKAKKCVYLFTAISVFTQNENSYRMTEHGALQLTTSPQDLPIVKLCSTNDALKQRLNSKVVRILERAALNLRQENPVERFRFNDAARQFQEIYLMNTLNKPFFKKNI